MERLTTVLPAEESRREARGLKAYHVFPVMVRQEHAALRNLDLSGAKSVPGILGFASARGAWGLCTSCAEDLKRLFADCEVSCSRPLVGLLVAEDKAAALHASKKITMSLLPLPSVNSIAEALLPSAPRVTGPSGVLKKTIPNHWLAREESPHNVERAVVIEAGKPSAALVAAKEIAAATVYLSSEEEGTEEVASVYRRRLESLFGRRIVLVQEAESRTNLPELRARTVLGLGGNGFLETVMLDLLIEVGGADADLEPYKSIAAAATAPYRLENLRLTLSACRTHRRVVGPPDAIASRIAKTATLAVEGAVEKLAKRLNEDPAHFRLKNLLSDRIFFLEEPRDGRRRSGFDDALHKTSRLAFWPERRAEAQHKTSNLLGAGFGFASHCEGWVQCEPWIQAVRLAGEPGGKIEAVLEVEEGFRSLTMLLTRLVALELGCDPNAINLTFGVPSRRGDSRRERFCLRGVELIRKAAQEYKWQVVSQAAENSSRILPKTRGRMIAWEDVLTASRLAGEPIEVSLRSEEEPPRSPFSSFWRMGWSVAELVSQEGSAHFRIPKGREDYPEASLVIRPALEGQEFDVYRSFGQWKNLGEKWWVLKDPHRDALWVWRSLGSREPKPEVVSPSACASALYQAAGNWPVHFPEDLRKD